MTTSVNLMDHLGGDVGSIYADPTRTFGGMIIACRVSVDVSTGKSQETSNLSARVLPSYRYNISDRRNSGFNRGA